MADTSFSVDELREDSFTSIEGVEVVDSKISVGFKDSLNQISYKLYSTIIFTFSGTIPTEIFIF